MENKSRNMYQNRCINSRRRFSNNFRLIGQVEGSSGSIMDNIAEGFERGTRMEFVQFFGYAKGSSGELRSQLYRALDRKYISQQQFDELYLLVTRVSSMLQSLLAICLEHLFRASEKENLKPLTLNIKLLKVNHEQTGNFENI